MLPLNGPAISYITDGVSVPNYNGKPNTIEWKIMMQIVALNTDRLSEIPADNYAHRVSVRFTYKYIVGLASR